MTSVVREVDVRGLRFVYRETGPECGSPVILLHALGRDGSDWDEVAAALAADGHRAIAPDLRGHGGSARPGEYSYELWRDDVGGLADALRLATFDVVGHSLGGCVAYLQHQLAEVAALVPDCRLVTVDGAGHSVHHGRPAEFLAAVRPFLR